MRSNNPIPTIVKSLEFHELTQPNAKIYPIYPIKNRQVQRRFREGIQKGCRLSELESLSTFQESYGRKAATTYGMSLQ